MAPMSSAGKRGDQAYRDAGVDYAVLDAGKRLAVAAALETSPQLERRGARAIDGSRGESAFVFELGDQTLAFVLEGLGTKSIIARAVAEAGHNHFADVAYDTVAAIVNDLCCVGARPLVVNAYFSTGKPDWFEHHEWHAQLIEGWASACMDAGCAWGGGESPSLPELVDGEQIELAGSAVGVVSGAREPILGQQLAPGDEIVLVASTGLHANGASLARMIASDLADGYATRLPSGQPFGAALLQRSHIYSGLAEAVLDAGLPVTYMSHITGHGFLKLMRPRRELTYRIERLLPVPEVLEFLVDTAGMTAKVAYSTLNMGSGFAIYCAAGAGEQIVALAAERGFAAIVGGQVETGARRVLIDPLGIELAGEQLRLGPDR